MYTTSLDVRRSRRQCLIFRPGAPLQDMICIPQLHNSMLTTKIGTAGQTEAAYGYQKPEIPVRKVSDHELEFTIA
jgi:hypothetical protein